MAPVRVLFSIRGLKASLPYPGSVVLTQEWPSLQSFGIAGFSVSLQGSCWLSVVTMKVIRTFIIVTRALSGAFVKCSLLSLSLGPLEWLLNGLFI
jgi:hypothetical protein